MKVLGIHDGHTATACVMENGKLLAMVSEERLHHEKEKGGFPKEAVKEVLRLSGVDTVDVVAVATLTPPLLPEEFSSPKFPRSFYQAAYRLLPRTFLQGSSYVDIAVRLSRWFSKREEKVKKALGDLGIKAPVAFVEHHLGHAATAFFGSGFEKALVVTLDGAGDGLSGSYYVGEGLRLERKGRISAYNSIGEFYTRITEYLGMKPLSHEYKVMGLAPYVNYNERVKKIYSRVKGLFGVEGDRIINRSGVYKADYLRLFSRLFFKVRFDVVAYVAQRLLEETVLAWIDNIRGGHENLAAAGGVFMNVKMNYHLLSRFKNVFVMPSAGDESLAYGAAAYITAQNGIKPQPIDTLYLGREFGKGEIEGALEGLDGKEFRIEEIGPDIHEYVAEMLAEGKVVARFFGRAEWGARALGNRSILADPRRLEVVQRINRMIKKRDFWMPFAPSVMEEDFERYFKVPLRTKSERYMILAYPANKEAVRDIPAALHQSDLTGRPQVVYEEDNPTYYRLIKRFKEKTGVGAVLNTSFNLHGKPIVYTPEQAVYTLRESDLDALAIGEYLVIRRRGV